MRRESEGSPDARRSSRYIPSAVREEVLERARDELVDFRGTGMSLMEMSHRSREFIDIAERATANGGSLTAGPTDRGYRVHAVLPDAPRGSAHDHSGRTRR